METLERDGGSTWFGDTRRDLPLVRLRYGGHEMGSYRVSRAPEHEMVVLVGMIRGVISFPIGKTLVIEDVPSVLPRAPATAAGAHGQKGDAERRQSARNGAECRGRRRSGGRGRVVRRVRAPAVSRL